MDHDERCDVADDHERCVGRGSRKRGVFRDRIVVRTVGDTDLAGQSVTMTQGAAPAPPFQMFTSSRRLELLGDGCAHPPEPKLSNNDPD